MRTAWTRPCCFTCAVFIPDYEIYTKQRARVDEGVCFNDLGDNYGPAYPFRMSSDWYPQNLVYNYSASVDTVCPAWRLNGK